MIAALIAIALLLSNSIVLAHGFSLTGTDMLAGLTVLIGLVVMPKYGRGWLDTLREIPRNTRWGIGLIVLGIIVGQLVSENRFSTTGTIKGLLITPVIIVIALLSARISRKQVAWGVVAFSAIQSIYLLIQPEPPLRFLVMLIMLALAFATVFVPASQRVIRFGLVLCVCIGALFAMRPPQAVVTGPELTQGIQYYPLTGQGMNRLPLMYVSSPSLGLPLSSRAPSSFFLYLWLTCGLSAFLGFILLLIQKERSVPLMFFVALGLLGGITVLPVTFLLFWLAIALPLFPDTRR